MLLSSIVRDASDRYLDAGKLMQVEGQPEADGAETLRTGREPKPATNGKRIRILACARIHPEVVVELDIKRVNDKKMVAGEKKCAEGRANYAVRLNAVALQAYEEALRLLPTDHACYPEAKDRVALLKK